MSEENLIKDTTEIIEWLASYGRDSEGGVSRLLYDKHWIEAQNALKEKFEETGFKSRYDDVGNLFAKLEGSKYPNETIATGSHVDSVTFGGKLDGAYGILAGYLATKYLKEKYGQPLRNIEIVSIAEEEGSRFPFTFWGSKNIVGKVDAKEVEEARDIDGISLLEAAKKAGFGPKESQDGLPEDWKSWIEVHIEQGGVLEIEKKQIGIVQHIVGQRRYTVELTGQANHAGTTPMKYRRDAGAAAGRIIDKIYQSAIEYGEPLVATVGSIEFTPGTVNVVPGKAKFSIDVRHTHREDIVEYTKKMEEFMRQIATENHLDIQIDLYMDENPVAMSQDIVETIEKQCQEAELSYKVMHSGAGHDTQRFAPLIPSAMIFVPSRDGISHNPAEYTEPEDLARGVEVLAHTLYDLAYKEEN